MDLEAAMAAAKQAEERANQLEEQLNKLKENNSALVEEKRRETEAKQALAEEARKASQELAKKNGDYEQILKSAEEERIKAIEELNKLKGDIATREVKSKAMEIAADIAFDAKAARILSDYISQRLKYTDDGVRVTNEKGELTVSPIEDLKKEFLSNDLFEALLKGTQATGGRPILATGRPGNTNPNPDQKLSPSERLHLAHEAKK